MKTFRKTGSDMDGVDDFICVEDARLIKREGNGFLEWRVDGVPVDEISIDVLLSRKPEMKDAERAMFDKVFGETDTVPARNLRPYEVGAALFHKGLIKIDGFVATITDLGKTYRK